MKLNFTSLLYFQRTAEMQHLTNAAESLHVAQPALSRMISGIEKELGVAPVSYTHLTLPTKA